MNIGVELIVPVILLLYLANSIKILNEYERAVIFRLGKLYPRPKGPGVILVFAPIDRMVRVSLRTIVMDVPPQDVITKDNVSVKVNAVVYFRVMDPQRSVVEVENFHYATSQLAQTTLRSVLGQVELDGLLSEREQLNQELQQILDLHTDPWGVKVSSVEVKHVDLPVDMQRAMAAQAEAEREKRAKIIHAEGEFIASEKLSQAAAVIGTQPLAPVLRYLQTLTEIAGEKNSTIVFPLPIDLLGALSRQARRFFVRSQHFQQVRLSPKQVVFLLIAAAAVGAVIFLFGVLVGRGVPLAQVLTGGMGAGMANSDRAFSDERPVVVGTPRRLPSAVATDGVRLSYHERLAGDRGPELDAGLRRSGGIPGGGARGGIGRRGGEWRHAGGSAA